MGIFFPVFFAIMAAYIAKWLITASIKTYQERKEAKNR